MDPTLSDVLHPYLVAWVLSIGAVAGSFLNVVIARLPSGRSVVRPRSCCPHCGALIAWYDNVPVLSWILLRARCRRCRASISFRYPLVELLGAGAGFLAFERHGLSVAAVAEFGCVLVLVALAFIDFDTWLLPHVLTGPLIVGGLAAAALHLSPALPLSSALIGAAVGFAGFWLIAFLGEKVFHREAMGYGDVWLVAALGAWNGAVGLLPIVLLSSVQGSLVGLLLIVLGKAQPGPPPTTSPPEPTNWVPPRHAIPFGPFLVAGALEWLYLSGPLARLIPPLELFR